MKKITTFLIIFVLSTILITSCATPTAPPPEIIEKEVEVIVTQEVEVIKEVEVEVETVVTEIVTEWVYVTPEAEEVSTIPQHGGEVTITYFQGFGPGFPDAHMSMSATNYMLSTQIYDTLVKYDAQRDIIPNLAKEWSISDDGLTFTFILEEGVLFHNGKELVAEDVVYSFERLRDPEISVMASFLEEIDTIEAIDDYTVTITTFEPSAPMLEKIAMFNMVIYPKDHNPTPAEAIGTGPYMVESIEPDVELVLVRNPNYWDAGEDGRPYIDRVIVNQIGDEMARFGALMSGTSDIIFTPPHSARRAINEDPRYTIFPGLTMYETVVLSTYNVEAFANPLVREAINIAISRKDLVDVALDGVGLPILGDLLVPGTWGYNDTEFMPFEGDLEKAKALLAEAGYADGFSFTLSVWEAWPPEIKAAQLMQERFKELNIEVDIEQVDPGIWVEKCYEGDIDAVFQGYGANIDPDYDFRVSHHPVTGFIHGVWENDTIVQMIDLASKEMDRDVREQIYFDLTDALFAHGEDTYTPVLPLWREPQDIALNSLKVHGYWDDGQFGNLSALEDMWVT
ncbi:MAG: ABC transporter substrate-binding protein, partial [Anaerolineaceae bacterium]|nr:ABC transporter substrate-binding protein [Anaerolineaceae bacterium]